MFYVACEIRDDPSLKNHPVAVGSSVISTSNYIARKYGVRSAMPTFVAKKLCPKLIVVKNNFPKYKAASDKFMEILREYDPDLESLGSDEGRMDITDYLESNNIEKSEEELLKLMDTIRKRIYDSIKVTASSGCGPNKMLAKLSSEKNKPDGQFFLKRDKETIMNFLDEMRIRKIPGIGAQCEYILNGLGIKTVKQLRERLFDLYLVFQENTFVALARRAYGISSVVHSESRERKSISSSRTFSPTVNEQELLNHLVFLAKDIERRAKRNGFVGRGVMITIKTNSFKVKQKSKKMFNYTSESSIILEAAQELFSRYKVREEIRLLGIRLDDLKKEDEITKNNLYSFFQKTEECVQVGKVKVIDIASEINNKENKNQNTGLTKEEEEALEEIEMLFEEDLDDLEREEYSVLSINSRRVEKFKKKNLKLKHDPPSESQNINPVTPKASSKESSKSITSAKKRKEFIKNTVICPSCSKPVKTDGNITLFNRHLDKCLIEKEETNQQESNVSMIEESSGLLSSKKDHSVKSTKSVLSVNSAKRSKRTKKIDKKWKGNGKKMKKSKNMSITNFFSGEKKSSVNN